MNSWTLKGKKALITGGTKGIGKAIVDEFVGLGADVIAVARAGTADKNPGAMDLEGDITDATFRQQLLYTINQRWGMLHILVNNVGTNVRKKFVEYTEEEYRKLFETNLFAMTALTQGAHDLLLKSGNASVINIASVAGSVDVQNGPPYGMTKAAIIQLGRHLAVEWAPTDPKVHKGHLTCPCCRKASLKLVKAAFVTEKGSRHARTCEYAVAAKPLSLFGQHFILYNPRYPPNSLATRFNGPLICIGKGPPEPWLGILKKTPSNHSIYMDGKNLMKALHAIQQYGNLQNTRIFNSGNAIRADQMVLDLTDEASDSLKDNLTDLFNALNAGDSYPVVIRAAVPPQQAQRESEYYGEPSRRVLRAPRRRTGGPSRA